jgi:DNA-binding GntR family transcriptional regulator
VAEFVPDYQRVAEDIRASIRDGRLRPGDQLPSRRELAQQYKVSLQTIGSAMIALQSTGWVRGHQGKGVYVSDNPPVK